MAESAPENNSSQRKPSVVMMKIFSQLGFCEEAVVEKNRNTINSFFTDEVLQSTLSVVTEL